MRKGHKKEPCPKGGMTFSEIAEILGVSKQAVEQGYRRAISKLALEPKWQAIAEVYFGKVNQQIIQDARIRLDRKKEYDKRRQARRYYEKKKRN